MTLSDEEKINLAQKAFLRYRPLCFWYLRPDLKVSLKNLPTIAAGLRKYGDREAFVIAQQLCR